MSAGPRLWEPEPPPVEPEICETCRGTGLATAIEEAPLRFENRRVFLGSRVWVPWGIKGDRPGIVIGVTKGGRLRLVLIDEVDYCSTVFCTRALKTLKRRTRPHAIGIGGDHD